MDNRTMPKAAGVPFLVIGIVFFAIAMAGDQKAFLGVGCAFIALGIVFIGKARKGGDA